MRNNRKDLFYILLTIILVFSFNAITFNLSNAQEEGDEELQDFETDPFEGIEVDPDDENGFSVEELLPSCDANDGAISYGLIFSPAFANASCCASKSKQVTATCRYRYRVGGQVITRNFVRRGVESICSLELHPCPRGNCRTVKGYGTCNPINGTSVTGKTTTKVGIGCDCIKG